MRGRHFTSLLVLAALAAGACTDRTPTANQAPSIQASNSRLDAARAALLTNIPVSDVAGLYSGTMSITHIDYDEASGQLLFSGTVRDADGTPDTFTGAVGTLSASQVGALPVRTPILGTNIAMVSTLSSMIQGTCPILLLDLQPLHLDLLGLVVDLNAVVLDVHAVQGPSNLLGNLLCAITGLLSGPAVTGQVAALIDRVNNILAAVGI